MGNGVWSMTQTFYLPWDFSSKFFKRGKPAGKQSGGGGLMVSDNVLSLTMATGMGRLGTRGVASSRLWPVARELRSPGEWMQLVWTPWSRNLRGRPLSEGPHCLYWAVPWPQVHGGDTRGVHVLHLLWPLTPPQSSGIYLRGSCLYFSHQYFPSLQWFLSTTTPSCCIFLLLKAWAICFSFLCIGQNITRSLSYHLVAPLCTLLLPKPPPHIIVRPPNPTGKTHRGAHVLHVLWL